MSTILVATVKGGSGKTTLSTNLASALAVSGETVMLADVDRQRSSVDWLARRPAEAAPIRGADWSKEIGRPPDDVAYTIIDAPAALKTKQIETLVGLADRILVPVVPSIIDEAATLRFLRKLDGIGAIAKGRKPVGVVGNRMRAGMRSSERLAGFLSRSGHRAVARIRDAQAYLDVAESGHGLFDRSGARVASLKEDWWPLIEFVRYG